MEQKRFGLFPGTLLQYYRPFLTLANHIMMMKANRKERLPLTLPSLAGINMLRDGN